MLRKILIGLVALLVVLVIVVATRPDTFHIERSITIAAPPAAAFAQVNDFHAWSAWSPWEKMDPNMKRTFAGSASGEGAQYAWVGNDEVGEGRMTIEKSQAPSLISIRLEFIKPFAATNTATFTFAPVAEDTKLTWGMDGKNDFMAKAAHLFMDIDAMVGKDFERGLTALKAVTESRAKAGAASANAPSR
ncbi:MAG TPA: SRPBCC family protein [Polyangiaceae bacterium]|nr:SRPBCC family protein [Polyangiaceae bacterium]